MASSAIGFSFVFNGDTGPEGPIGARGPTGNTGDAAGLTGPIGPYAPNIVDIFVDGSTATILFSDNSTFEVYGDFMGATGIDYGIVNVSDPLNPDTDVTTHSLLSSGRLTSSFVVRGISGTGSLIVTEDEDAIYIDSIYTPSSGSLDSVGLTDNTLVYLKKSSQMSSTTIGITSGDYYDGVLNFEKSGSSPSTPSFSNLLARSKVKYVPPTYKTETPAPVTLNVNDAGVFYVRTPNGISAFGGNFKPSEVTSFTIITESDDIWHFPSNVYFQNGENYLTCGKSILNLTTFDQGTSWYATVSARGVDASEENCSVRSLLGSCCYRGPTGQLCADYVTRSQCDILSGTFNPLTPCDVSCGTTFGVCCSNGQCIENTNYAECLAFGGKFLFGVTCGSFGATDSGDNTQRLCYDGCLNQKVACCKDGQCLGDEFTVIECEDILGGFPFAGQPCSSVDCCEQNTKEGACCTPSGCIQKTLIDCKDSGGIFMGEGELCESVNCLCVVPLATGRCCYCSGNNQICEDDRTQSYCVERGGDWLSDGTCSNNACLEVDCNLDDGRCCFCDSNSNRQCSDVQNQIECDTLNGSFRQGSTCEDSACTDSDINCIDLGRCCECVGGQTNCSNNVAKNQCGGDWNTDNSSCASTPCNDECPPSTSCGPCSVSQDGSLNCDQIEPTSNYNNDLRNRTSSTNNTFNFSYPLRNFSGNNIYSKLPFEFVDNSAPTDTNRLALFPLQKSFDFIIPKEAKTSNDEDIIKIDNNGTGRICINLEFNPDINIATKIKSARFYLLRTWYPNHYGINKAAFEQVSHDQPYNYIDPNASFDEKTVSFTYNDTGTSVDTRYLKTQISGQFVRYYPNTRELRDEINGPLYGYRGTFGAFDNLESFINFEANDIDTRPSITDNEVNFNLFYNNLGLNISKKIFIAVDGSTTTPGNDSVFNTFSFTRIGDTNFNYVRYQDGNALKLADSVKVYKNFHNTVIDSLGDSIVNTLGDNDTITLPIGYCDGGYAKNYSNDNNILSKPENSKYRYYAISSFGFANKFVNLLDLSRVPEFSLQDPLFNYGLITPGHPITTDLIQQNVEFISGSGLGNDNFRDKHYKTREEAIIFDSGILTSDGRMLRDILVDYEFFGVTFDPGLSGYVSLDENNDPNLKYVTSDAINDYYGFSQETTDAATGITLYNVTTPKGVIRRIDNSVTGQNQNQRYTFCITIPNIKDYMLPDGYVFDNDSDLDYVSSGIDSDLSLITIERKRKLFENVLRGVLFVDVEPSKNSDNIESNQNLNMRIDFGTNGQTCSLDSDGDFNLVQNQGECDLCSVISQNEVIKNWLIVKSAVNSSNLLYTCDTNDGIECTGQNCPGIDECCNKRPGGSVDPSFALILSQCESPKTTDCRLKIIESSTASFSWGSGLDTGCPFKDFAFSGIRSTDLAELGGFPITSRTDDRGNLVTYALPLRKGSFYDIRWNGWPIQNPKFITLLHQLAYFNYNVVCDGQFTWPLSTPIDCPSTFDGDNNSGLHYSCFNQNPENSGSNICDIPDIIEADTSSIAIFQYKLVDTMYTSITNFVALVSGLQYAGFPAYQYANRQDYYTPTSPSADEITREYYPYSKTIPDKICEDCSPFSPNNFTSISVGGICQQIDCNASVENARLCANNTRCPE